MHTTAGVEGGVEAYLRRMDAAEARKERRRRKRVRDREGGEVTATDLGLDLATWEGPRFEFALFLGVTAPAAGPAAQWIDTGSGAPCLPGDEPPEDGDGRSRPRPGVRCRFCGHLRRLPADAACCNPGCSRTGVDRLVTPGKRRGGNRKYRPDKKLKGGK